MNTYISLLRGINVSGHNLIRKNELVELYTGLGFERVETYLQSGNVIFDSGASEREELAAQIEVRIQQALGYEVAVLVRGVEYFQSILEANPFVKQRSADPAALYVTFLYIAPALDRLAELQVPPGETAEFAAGEDAIYLFVPGGYGRTKLSNAFFERKLAVPATTRSWNTVQALVKMGLRSYSIQRELNIKR
jgi:uncharacterized protein (DUF1697 family)